MNEIYSVSGQWKVLKVTKDPGRVERVDWALTNSGLYDLPYKGEGQKVGVIDTGCDIGHQDLKGNVVFEDFISEKKISKTDVSGHGTFVMGQIVAKEDGVGVVGVAPLATGYSARVIFGNMDDMYRHNISKDLANAIVSCTDAGCRVINMSLGGPQASLEIKEALNYAVSKGVIPVAAAGNERMDGVPQRSYPAAYENVISVAAANKKNMPYWFSTIGVPGPDTTQPEIAVAMLEYYYGCLPRPTSSSASPYGVMIGTSQAAPIISGALILWAEAMTKSGKMPIGEDVLKEARLWLRRVAVDTNKNGWDPEIGYGVLLLKNYSLIQPEV
jgi:subtilisin family serine protease